MVIDSQALAFWVGVAVCVAYVLAWFLPFDHVNDREKAFDFMMVWMFIGWFPMGCIGLGLGLIVGYLMGTPTEFTTGGALTGMALYIPVGVIAHNLYERTL